MFRKEDDPSLLSGLNFQFTLSLLWLLSTLLNLPTLLAWVQNLDKVGTYRKTRASVVDPDPNGIRIHYSAAFFGSVFQIRIRIHTIKIEEKKSTSTDKFHCLKS